MATAGTSASIFGSDWTERSNKRLAAFLPMRSAICKIVLSEQNRCSVNIPEFVWHADHNIGSVDAVVVNFPTSVYDHGAPDKYRLPIDTDLIPYSFGEAKGW